MQHDDEQLTYEENAVYDPNNNSENVNYYSDATNHLYQQNQYQIYFDDEYDALASATNHNFNDYEQNDQNSKIGVCVSTRVG